MMPPWVTTPRLGRCRRVAPEASPALVRKVFALFREGGVGGKENRRARLAVCEFVTWEPVSSTDDLTAADLAAIVKTLEYWKHRGEIEYRCRRIGEKFSVTATTEAGQR